MPDFFDNRAMEGTQGGWAEIFAALPSETPPTDGWMRLSRALDARSPHLRTARRERRMSWVIGIASAAVLVLVAWSPLSRWRQADGTKTQPPAMATNAPGLRGPAAHVRVEPDVAVVMQDVGARSAVSLVGSHGKPTLRKPTHKPRVVAKRTEVIGPSLPVSPGSRVTTGSSIAGSEAGGATSMTAASATTTEALQKLKTQSAQLEALVALARDDRVGNASGELLSGELDAGIAAIDAALSQPGLDDARKQELWRQRVNFLQQLAGMEATSRWLAAQGTANDTTLVSVD